MVIECNGKYIVSRPGSDGEKPIKNKRRYALGVIEPNTTTTIEFSVVLPTADQAGVGNKLYIRDKLTYLPVDGKIPKGEEIIF